LLRSLGDSACNSKHMPYELTRRVVVPGIAAMLTIWLIQSGLDPRSKSPAWVLHVRIPFTFIFPLIHYDLIVSFAVAGALSALYGALAVASSPKQRYIAALFPAFFEILKWMWLLRYPLAAWVDPAHPPYRFGALPVAASIGYWVVHIIIPAAAAVGVVYFVNRWLSTSRQNHGMEPSGIR
jgi:hypothetical protein